MGVFAWLNCSELPSERTLVCPKCNGTGTVSRTCPTQKTSGNVELRYAPKNPRLCDCQTTVPNREGE